MHCFTENALYCLSKRLEVLNSWHGTSLSPQAHCALWATVWKTGLMKGASLSLDSLPRTCQVGCLAWWRLPWVMVPLTELDSARSKFGERFASMSVAGRAIQSPAKFWLEIWIAHKGDVVKTASCCVMVVRILGALTSEFVVHPGIWKWITGSGDSCWKPWSLCFIFNFRGGIFKIRH